MKIVYLITRIVIGVLYLFESISFFLGFEPNNEINAEMSRFMDGMVASIYLLPLVKALEFICGIALVVNRFISLVAIIILPITINIFLIHLFLNPSEVAVGLLLTVANSFLIYYNWNNYRGVFVAK